MLIFQVNLTGIFFVFQGIGMDACILPLRKPGLFLAQTTDFFYALVDDPYVQVKDLTLTLATAIVCYKRQLFSI